MNMDTARVIDLRACVSKFTHKFLNGFDILVLAYRGHKLNRVLLIVCSSSACFAMNRCIGYEFPLTTVIAPNRVRIINTADMVGLRTEVTCYHLSCFSSCDACHLDLDTEALASHELSPSVGA